MWPPVKRKLKLSTLSVTAPGTAQQLSSNPVPDGHVFTLKSRRSNTGNLYFGTSQTNAQGNTTRKVIVPGESKDFRLIDSNLIWVDADNSTDVFELDLPSD